MQTESHSLTIFRQFNSLTLVKVVVTGLNQRLVSITIALGVLVLLVIIFTLREAKLDRRNWSIHRLMTTCGSMTSLTNWAYQLETTKRDRYYSLHKHKVFKYCCNNYFHYWSICWLFPWLIILSMKCQKVVKLSCYELSAMCSNHWSYSTKCKKNKYIQSTVIYDRRETKTLILSS